MEALGSSLDDGVATSLDKFNKDLPPSPCRGRSSGDDLLEWSKREEEFCLRERDLAERLQNLEFREFLLQEEKQQHQENIRLLAQRTGSLEDREARVLEQERRLSGSSSHGGSPPSSNKKLRRSPIVSTPPRKQVPESVAQQPLFEEQRESISQTVAIEEPLIDTSCDSKLGVIHAEPKNPEQSEDSNGGSNDNSGLIQPDSKKALDEVKKPKSCNRGDCAPHLAHKARRCQCGRTLIGRLFCCGFLLQVLFKAFVFAAIAMSPRFHEASVQSMALRSPEPLWTFMNDLQAGFHVRPGKNLTVAVDSGSDDCQRALRKLRLDLTQLHAQGDL